MDGRFLIFANRDVSKRNTSAGCALPVSGYDTTADYGMGLVPIFYLWILLALIDSAAMDGRFVI